MASVIAALSLNVTALGVFAGATRSWQSPPVNTRQVSWITATMRVDSRAEPTRTVAETDAPQTVAGTKPRSNRFRAVNVDRHAAPTAPPEAPPADPAGADEPIRFYAFDEVDRPAEPDSDWNLDPAALDAFGVQDMVFDIFISRAGEVVDCRIVEPGSLPDEARVALEGRLRQTVVQPAVRHDTAVASVRRIEIAVVAQGL